MTTGSFPFYPFHREKKNEIKTQTTHGDVAVVSCVEMMLAWVECAWLQTREKGRREAVGG